MQSGGIQSESLHIRLEGAPGSPGDETTLHLERIRPPGPPERLGRPVFMLHGSLSNGRVFYSRSGKGLGPFLARRGYDVYIGDLRGRGESRPRIAPGASHGQNESIRQEIPAMIREIRRLRGEIPQHWVAHSWGGVLSYSVLARFPEYRSSVRSMVLLATRRSIRQNNWGVFWKFHFFWHRVGPWLAKRKGYLPARELRFGADNETILSL
ncbi:MAG: alpha/beta fold hydrolase, partial [Gammaproteobacteria bacterium]|nr:alpha/beta hydrolase [Gemmatimonadota bacterium]NIU77367.1 alpha/beta fold hydrolase [Gammaproteobacteria bacterium]NIY10950.1 alpha/beta fold hydrolase [Gemmatimonadota bacterium]